MRADCKLMTSNDKNLSLQSTTGVPLYHQIQVLLRSQIESGDLPPGSHVMGEAALCDRFGVSRITARRALNELAKEGLVERVRGKGTIVAEGAQPDPLKTTFDGLIENVGHIGRTTTVRVLRSGMEPASNEVAEALQLAPGDPVMHALRVRDLGGVAMSYLETWIPERLATRIVGQDMSATPLLLLLEAAGVPVASASQTITAGLADAPVAMALGIPAGAPLIDVRRTVADDSDVPVEYIKILYRPEMYQFQMSMRRVGSDTHRSWRAGDVAFPVGPQKGADQDGSEP